MKSADSEPRPARYAFGCFMLEPAQRRVLRNGAPLALTPRLFDALQLFVEHPGELLERDFLIQTLWPGLVVEDNNLSQVVSALRRALGEAQGSRFIETVPRRGFRFIAPVAVLQAHDSTTGGARDRAEKAPENLRVGMGLEDSVIPDAKLGVLSHWPRLRTRRWWSVALAVALIAATAFEWLAGGASDQALSPPTSSLAVLPFRASGDVPDTRYAETFTRDLTARIRQSGPSVSAYDAVTSHRNTSADLHALAKELNVRYFVDGSVGRAGEATVATISLIDALRGKQLASIRVDTPMAKAASWPDLPAIRATNAIVRLVVNAELPRIAGIPRQDRSALEHALLGLNLESDGTLEGVSHAKASCDEALRLDPRLPAALNCKAWSLKRAAEWPTPRFADLAREADELSRRSLSLAGDNALSWTIRANVLGRLQHQWTAAMEANAQAIRLDPSRTRNYVDRAQFFIKTGHPAEALPLLERATDVETGSPAMIERVRCSAYIELGSYQDAVTSCERSASREEEWIVQVYLAVAYAQLGDMQRADAARQRAMQRRAVSVGWFKREFSQLTDDPTARELWNRNFAPGLVKAGFPES